MRRSLWVLLGALATTQARPAEPYVPLDVPDFSPSLVYLPEGDAKAPALVVTHGAGGTAEGHCELWSRITKHKAVLLCVRARAVRTQTTASTTPTTSLSSARRSRP